MANLCYIQIDIQLNNIFDKDRVFDCFEKIFHNAHSKDEGAYIGIENRYLFDAEINDVNDCEIEIIGWVKWGIQGNEIISFFKYLNEICFLQEVIVKEFESGNGVCDKFVYHHSEENKIKYYALHDKIIFEAVAKEEENEEHSAMYECFEKLENAECAKEIEIEE